MSKGDLFKALTDGIDRIKNGASIIFGEDYVIMSLREYNKIRKYRKRESFGGEKAKRIRIIS